MKIILIKKISLLLLLLSAALFSTSLAGRLRKSGESKKVSTTDDELMNYGALSHQNLSQPPKESLPMETKTKTSQNFQEMKSWGQLRKERILKVKTNDYGKYDPAPALVKPPFKLIPN
ncbi:uncharacterized protein LOC142526591 isoform X1 [Primulina tabacum]|uniref:uncharacterized protein LOC142526591 isoform X1 n=1 Tax=Primulina tabacum TaxID=48773 RepID=UPI003F593C1F